MKKLLIVVICLLSFSSINAQVGGVNSQLSEITPSSPNAAAMTQYGKISIGEFTGTMQHSIDLYTIKHKDLEIPITLNYSSNGVSIDQFESIAGIDWSLNWGGVISRMQMDDPDENCPINFPEPPYQISDPILQYIINSECADIQPDIFYYNIAGYSGRFYLNNPGSSSVEAIMIDPTPVKIEILNGFGFVDADELEDVKITLPNGTICWFGGNFGSDYTFSISHQYGTQGHPPPTIPSKTAMYISRIQSSNGNEIEFNYNVQGYNRYTGISQSVTAIRFSNGILSGAHNDTHKSPVTLKSYGQEAFLSNITWGNNQVNFTYNDNLINKLEVKHNDNLVQENQFQFLNVAANEDYFNPDCSYCGTNTIRSFLKKIIKINLSDNLQNEVFEFEYYSPENLPPRLSYARDYWGYFNGKNNSYLVPNDVSKFNPGDYNSSASEAFNYSIIQDVFSLVGGDRNTDPNYAKNGMLKKIKYPTKGETEVIYEANSYWGEISIPGQQTTSGLNVTTDEDNFPDHDSVVITLPSNQIIEIYGYGEFNISCEENMNTGAWHHKSILQVQRLDTDELVELYTWSGNSGGSHSVGLSYFFNEETEINNVHFFGEEGVTYEITISALFNCVRGGCTFTYESTAPTIYNDNIPYGGMRVKSIINRSEDGIATKENFYYGDLDCLECSNAVFETLKPAISFFQSGTNSPYGDNKTLCSLGSTSLNPLYFSSSTPISYPIVSKRLISDNANNGLVVHEYNVIFDNIPIVELNDLIPGTPHTNGFGNGDLLKETVYNNNMDKQYERIHHYSFIDDYDDTIEGHNISTSSKITITHAGGMNQEFTWFNINKYFIQTKRQFMDYIIEREFTPNGTLEKRTDFMYNGANKLLKSSEYITNSDGKTHITNYKYPPDLIGLEQTPSMQELTDANRISDPVITENFVKHGALTEKTSETHIKYGNNSDTGNLLLPIEVHSNIGNADININNIEHRKIIYTKYGTNGNILEYELENGIPVSIIWGYDEQYPIAKIEGENYANLSSYITTLQSASDNGTLTVASFDTLRNGLPGALVTGYVYEPLVGVKVITHPNGTTEYYDYDAFGRLIEVKNSQGEVIRKLEYNYKPQS